MRGLTASMAATVFSIPLKNQLKNAAIGFAAMIFFMKMDYHNFKTLKLPILKKFNIAGLLYVAGLYAGSYTCACYR